MYVYIHIREVLGGAAPASVEPYNTIQYIKYTTIWRNRYDAMVHYIMLMMITYDL